MSIDNSTVKKVAKLARIKIDPNILTGKIHRPNSFESRWRILRGDYSISKN